MGSGCKSKTCPLEREKFYMNGKLATYYEKLINYGLPISAFLVAISFYLKTYDSCQIKITLFQMGATIIVVAWLMKNFEHGRFPVKKSSLLVVLPVLVFLCSGIISHIFFSPFKATSFEELIRRILYVGTFLVIFFEYSNFQKVKRLLLWMILEKPL